MVEVRGSPTILPGQYDIYVAGLRNQYSERLTQAERFRIRKIQRVIHEYVNYVNARKSYDDTLNIKAETKNLLKENVLPANITGVKLDTNETIELDYIDRQAKVDKRIVVSFLDINAVDKLLTDIVENKPLNQLTSPEATSQFPTIFVRSLLYPKARVK